MGFEFEDPMASVAAWKSVPETRVFFEPSANVDVTATDSDATVFETNDDWETPDDPRETTLPPPNIANCSLPANLFICPLEVNWTFSFEADDADEEPENEWDAAANDEPEEVIDDEIFDDDDDDDDDEDDDDENAANSCFMDTFEELLLLLADIFWLFIPIFILKLIQI